MLKQNTIFLFIKLKRSMGHGTIKGKVSWAKRMSLYARNGWNSNFLKICTPTKSYVFLKTGINCQSVRF